VKPISARMKTFFTLLLCCAFYITDAQVIAVAGPDLEICVNDQLQVTGNGLTTGDTGSYRWKNLNTGQVVSNTRDLTITISTPGEHAFELLVTLISNGKTYTDVDSFMLNSKPLPVIKISVPDTICSASTITLQNLVPSGNVGTWSGQGVSVRTLSPSFGPGVKYLEGPYTVNYSYTDPSTSCISSTSETYLVQTAPRYLDGPPKPFHLCEGYAVSLHPVVTWANNVSWTTDGDGTFSDKNKLSTVYSHGINDTITGKVILSIHTVREGVCPSIKLDRELIIEPFPQFTLPQHIVQCEPARISFSPKVTKPASSSNLRYSWWFGNGDSLVNSTISSPQNIRYDSAKRGWYDVTLIVSNQWGTGPNEACWVKKDFTDYVKILPQPKTGFSSNPAYYTTTASPEFIFKNKTQARFGWDNMQFLWNFDVNGTGDTSTQRHPKHTYPADTGIYWVELVSRYHYFDDITQSNYYCWDSVGEPRKVGPAINDMLLMNKVQNEQIRLILPFHGILEVFDANGKLLEKRNALELQQDFDIRIWACGTYLFVVTDGKERETIKFLKF
jgi:hypothetical protein